MNLAVVCKSLSWWSLPGPRAVLDTLGDDNCFGNALDPSNPMTLPIDFKIFGDSHD